MLEPKQRRVRVLGRREDCLLGAHPDRNRFHDDKLQDPLWVLALKLSDAVIIRPNKEGHLAAYDCLEGSAASADPNRLLRRHLAREIESLFETPRGHEGSDLLRADIDREFFSLELRLQNIFPCLGSLSGRQQILGIRGHLKAADQAHNVAILWIYHGGWDCQDTLLCHAQQVHFPKVG